MRIDNYGKVLGVYKTNKLEKNRNISKKSSTVDTVEISGTAKTLQAARAAVSKASDIREDKVAAIKKSIEDGTYSVSSMDIADKLVNSL